MYAIIATGGKQYKVSEGDVIKVEKIDAEAGNTVTVAQTMHWQITRTALTCSSSVMMM